MAFLLSGYEILIYDFFTILNDWGKNQSISMEMVAENSVIDVPVLKGLKEINGDIDGVKTH